MVLGESQLIGTDMSSKTWGTSHTYVAIYTRARKTKIVLATMPRDTQNDQDRLVRELVMSVQIDSFIQRRCKRCAKGDHCKIANMVSHTK